MSFMLAPHLPIYFIMKFLRKCVLTNKTLLCDLTHVINYFIASRGDYFIFFAYLAAQFRQLFVCNIPHNHSEPHKCSFQTVPLSTSRALMCSVAFLLLMYPAGIWLQLVYSEDHTTEYTWSISLDKAGGHPLATLCKSS